jgi:AraC-like DNA-binding protein
MTLQIRNMASNRCIAYVMKELNKLGLKYKTVELGKVEFNNTVPPEYLSVLDNALKEIGLEIIGEKKDYYIEKIKTAIQQWMQLSENHKKISISEYISRKVNHNYGFLSNLFSRTQGITIEKYIINQKIVRVKELLIYSDLTLNEIAYRLGYSSVAHLSGQFKKVTGLTASQFREIRR